jgi:NAD(P) transhydrogenase subunit alpha
MGSGLKVRELIQENASKLALPTDVDKSMSSLMFTPVFGTMTCGIFTHLSIYIMVVFGVPKETQPGENRVALNPDSVAQLVKLGVSVHIETNAGIASYFTDAAYEAAGATIQPSVFGSSDVVLKVAPPTLNEVKQLKSGSILISFLWAVQNRDIAEALRTQGVSALGMEAVPRITRAQNMDALSSMSSIAGYKAVLMAASHLGKYLPMMMTAAGTIAPAKCLILGAGVAGLQAIATARRLGAVVEAFDVRPAVKEQVESLGAKFVDVDLVPDDTETKGGYAKELSEENKKRQKDALAARVKAVDFVITTALIPGKPAPKLITKEMVESMAPGSVIVDLAAEQGGNCEVTVPGQTVSHHHVQVLGPLNIPSGMPLHASQLYSKNVLALLKLMIKDGAVSLDFSDEIIEQTTITHAGEWKSPTIKSLLGVA